MIKEIESLLHGNKRFQKKFYSEDKALFNELAQGQYPKVMVISCCDSRVDPNIIFNCQLGQLFVIRNVANLVPPYQEGIRYDGVSSGLEYGVCVLGVQNIIVLGHSDCGGIRALVENHGWQKDSEKTLIAKWMFIARPAYDQMYANKEHGSFNQQVMRCNHYSLINSLKNLETFPWISDRITSDKLSLHAWYFDLKSGSVQIINHHQ